MNPRSALPHNFLWDSPNTGGTSEFDPRQQPYRDQGRSAQYPIRDHQYISSQNEGRYRYSYPVPYHGRAPPPQDPSRPANEPWYQSTYQRVVSLAENIMLPAAPCSNMSSSPADARNVSDDHIYLNDHDPATSSRSHPDFEASIDGDVVVVQPSFDDHDARKPPNSPSPVKGSQHEWQSRSPPQEQKEDRKEESAERNPSSPSDEETAVRRHVRNLSDHFYDATKLVDTPDVAKDDYRSDITDENTWAIALAGRKHQRIFSGDLANRNVAHRRLDSFGSSSLVNRQYPEHHRVDSAGLDILSAAVEVTKEELAVAAGQQQTNSQLDPTKRFLRESSISVPMQQQYRYHASGHPLSGPSYSLPGRDNPNMYPPHQREHSGPPILPALGSSGHSQYMAPPSMHQHHRQFGPRHSSSYPPSHPYHPHQLPQHSYFPPPSYQQRGNNPPPNKVHHPYASHQFAGGNKVSAMKPPENRKPQELGSHLNARVAEAHFQSSSDVSWKSPNPSGATATHQGSQTFVTAIGVGEGNKTIQSTSHLKHAGTNTDDHLLGSSTPVPCQISGQHHRKMSSFSSIGLGTIFGTSILSPGGPATPPQHPLKSALAPVGEGRHHRSTSSVSFLNVLDSENENFLRNLHESIPEYRSPEASVKEEPKPPSPMGNDLDMSDSIGDSTGNLASGGTSKRVRRKCTVSGCRNRVVQGGLCITHGAKRKVCQFPGCPKNVKKAGYCSSHGPARKRCETNGCQKVAVQGGHCIAHGAKKKLCSVDDCNKQAILCGMCKKHHDLVKGKTRSKGKDDSSSTLELSGEFCREVIPEPSESADLRKAKNTSHKPSHTRGLSIFHDISADTVQSLLNNTETTNELPGNVAHPGGVAALRPSDNADNSTW